MDAVAEEGEGEVTRVGPGRVEEAEATEGRAGEVEGGGK